MRRSLGRHGFSASLILALLGLPGAVTVARADEALLRNGRTLSVSSFRMEGERVVLVMEGGGEIALPKGQVLAIRRSVAQPAGDGTRPEEAAPSGTGIAPRQVEVPTLSAAVGAVGEAPLRIAPGNVRDRPTLRDLAARVARRHEVDESLVQAVIEVESRYDPFAVSPRGAMGLMQLMPETVTRFAVRNAFDPAENLDGGVRYLKELLGRYSGQVRLALAAYNAGEEAVERFGGIPPYRETEQYVVRVMRALPR
jgi:Transglycosylase SLT domain